MALSVEVSHLLEKGGLLSLLSGSQIVRGDETHPGSPLVGKIPNASSCRALHQPVKDNNLFMSLDAYLRLPILKANRKFHFFAFMGVA